MRTDLSLLISLLVLAGLLVTAWVLLARGLVTARRRPLEALYSLPTEAGRAVEEGGSVHVSVGPGSLLNADQSGITLAGLSALSSLTASSAIGDKPPIATTADPVSFVLAEAIIQNSFTERSGAGAAQLTALEAYGLAGAVPGVLRDNAVQASVLIGAFGPEVILPAEAAYQRGVHQVIGSSLLEGQAAAAAAADEPLLGEDAFAVRAYLEPAPAALSALLVQDVLRLLVIGAVVVGGLATALLP